MASIQELLNAQSAVADRNRAKDWSARNRAAFGGILDVNQYLPVTGDIQSGILAAQDLGEGAYGSAALNALGLLPFIPAMGGVVKKAGKAAKITDLDLNESGIAIAKSFFGWNPDLINKAANKNPISVVKLPNGKLHVLDGYHRVVQAQAGGKNTIKINEIPMTDVIYDLLVKQGNIAN